MICPASVHCNYEVSSEVFVGKPWFSIGREVFFKIFLALLRSKFDKIFIGSLQSLGFKRGEQISMWNWNWVYLVVNSMPLFLLAHLRFRSRIFLYEMESIANSIQFIWFLVSNSRILLLMSRINLLALEFVRVDFKLKGGGELIFNILSTF